MAIGKVHAGLGWAPKEKLTSIQVNQLDTNAASALDKRSGQTDTLASNVTVTGNLALNGTNTAANLTAALLTVSGATHLNGTTTVAAAMNISGNINSTASINLTSGGDITLTDGSVISVPVGASISVPGGSIDVGSTGSQSFASGSALTVSTGSTALVHIGSASALYIDNGGHLNVQSGGTVNVNTANTLVSGGGTFTITDDVDTTIAGAVITGAMISGGNVGAANGLATLGSDGKLTASQRSSTFIGAGNNKLSNSFTVSSASYSASGITYTDGAATAGDIYMICPSLQVGYSGAGNLQARVMITDGGTVNPIQSMLSSAAGFATQNLTRTFVYVAATSGTLTVYIETKTSSGSPVLLGADATDGTASTLTVVKFRP